MQLASSIANACHSSIANACHSAHLLVHDDIVFAGRRLHGVPGPLEVQHLHERWHCLGTSSKRPSLQVGCDDRSILPSRMLAPSTPACRLMLTPCTWPGVGAIICVISSDKLHIRREQEVRLGRNAHLVTLGNARLLAGAILLKATRPCSDHGARNRLLLRAVGQQHAARCHVRHLLHLRRDATKE